MDDIPADVRDAGYGFPEKYVWLQNFDNSDFMVASDMQMDMLYKKAYIQSLSYDKVEKMAKRAGEMASCVPTIPPVFLNHIKFSSGFGVRVDPIEGGGRMHAGIDLAGHQGEPIYATGNGRVAEVDYSFFGYGNEVVVDHGFGYRTRYAHLSRAIVRPGAYVQRGQQIAMMGSTGRSTGTHLHYEVEYRGSKVNPMNYFKKDISPEEYSRMIKRE
ncbi:MAG: M23 family metallopeptidase [Bacteroidales bacterium]|jgi:murein DD-endopeptidase MepM/ murein hydrolase activator NlpD|nr:M23 family metallopeptidase [Bacteroidales bacterium]